MIIDGKKISDELCTKIAKKVNGLSSKPGLVVILVGEDPASKVYVNKKQNACKKVGFYSEKVVNSEDISEQELLAQIEKFNQQDNIDGILVQLPLPKHINPKTVLEAISPEKDVDGFHCKNIGKLAQNQPFLRPCTPKGVMTLFAVSNIDVAGKDVIMIGASHIVGRPMALELFNSGATVTVCNRKTTNLIDKVKRADIIIVAVGIPYFVKAEWVKENAIVIDIGINRLDNGKLVGDVDFDAVKEKASFITPVPGGVGPMTIASLLENTLISYKNRVSLKD